MPKHHPFTSASCRGPCRTGCRNTGDKGSCWNRVPAGGLRAPASWWVPFTICCWALGTGVQLGDRYGRKSPLTSTLYSSLAFIVGRVVCALWPQLEHAACEQWWHVTPFVRQKVDFITSPSQMLEPGVGILSSRLPPSLIPPFPVWASDARCAPWSSEAHISALTPDQGWSKH